MHTLPENWRPIPDGEGSYEVSDHGRIRGLDRTVDRGGRPMRVRGRPIKTPLKSSGYPHFKLAHNGAITYPMVHRCVAAAFLPPAPGSHYVNHKDGDKTNNHVSNLEYVTASENAQHAVRERLASVGEAHTNAKLTEHQVRAIRAAQGTRSAKDLAAEYGVAEMYIPLIWRRRRWKHVR